MIMKKLIFISCLILVFTSCSKEDDFNEKINTAKIAQLSKERNIDNQKVMYNMLTKEEKYTLWKDKIENLIQNGQLNQSQLDLIFKFKSHLKVDFFDVTLNYDEKEIFKTVYIKDFLKEARKIFSDKVVYETFYSMSSFGKETAKLSSSTDFSNSFDVTIGTKPNCYCNKTSLWSCTLGMDECKYDGCQVLADGCGFLGFSECNGRCY